MTFSKLILRLVLMPLLLLSGLIAHAAPAVVASIRPLHMIASEIMQGVGEPLLLIGAGSDPHHYSMRLSERRMLASADILLWVGPQLELPLKDLVDQLDAQLITSSDLPDLHLIENDAHLWLDAGNASRMAQVLADALIVQDPANKNQYTQNLSSFRASLNKVDEKIATLFSQQPSPFAVYHNAFSYFEQRYGLQHAVSLTQNEALKPGIQQILKFRRLAKESGLNCVISEPDVNPLELASQLGSENLNLVSVDPLGKALAPLTSYASFLEGIAITMYECIEGEEIAHGYSL